MIEENKVIRFNNKKYVVVRLIKLYGTRYAYLNNIDDVSDFFWGKVVNQKIIEIKDEKLLNLLIEEM